MLHHRLEAVCLLHAVLLLTLTDGSSLNHNDTESVSTSFIPKNSSSLVLLQLLFRHGDRSPTHLFPWDEHSTSWPQGPGQLTKLGMDQAYEYGGELKKMYSGFLPAEYDRFAVDVQSTDYDRTLMTVQCMLVGLFPANDTATAWPPWQPIPIHTRASENDHLFIHAPCPKVDALWSQSENSERFQRFTEKFKSLREQLSRGTNTTVNHTVSHQISDAMFCEAQHNMSRPTWMTEAMFQQLMDLRNETYQIVYTEPGMAQLMGGPLLAEMTSNMERRAHNSSSKEKLFLFSAHDNTVAALGRAMGIFNNLQPPYLTSIIVELHQQDQGFYVKTLFHNHTRDSPFVMTIEGCDQMCPLSEFHQLLKDRMVSAADREKACALSTASQFWKENGTSILTGAVVVLVVTVTVMAYKLRKSRRQHRERQHIKYHKLLHQGADNNDDDDGHNDS